MTRDAMTGGGWALWAACTALFIALIAWLIAAGSRELDELVAGHARETRLRRALADHAATVGLILGWHDEDSITQAAAEVVAEAEEYARQAS